MKDKVPWFVGGRYILGSTSACELARVELWGRSLGVRIIGTGRREGRTEAATVAKACRVGAGCVYTLRGMKIRGERRDFMRRLSLAEES
jgi:hypothetical protein